MKGKDLKHRQITNTALPYITTDSPTATDRPSFATDSRNLLTTISGYMEHRPGFPQWVSTALAFTFSAEVKRIFTWRRWTSAAVTLSGAHFTMWSVCTSSQSFVYKQRVGTDTYPALLHSDTTSALPFEYEVSNNFLFFANGTDMKKYDGSSVTNWGITAPTAAVTFSSASGSLSPVYGFQWVIAWENSSTGHISSPSPVSLSTGAGTSQKYTFTGNTTADTQVSHVRFGRTIDGGSIYFEHPSSPITYAVWTASGFEDNIADSLLTTAVMPLPNQNNRPTASHDPVWFANRLWTHQNDTLYYSAFEELVRGVEEESFPSTALRSLGREIIAKKVAGQYMLVFTPSVIYRIYGDSISTFRLDVLAENKGALSSQNVCSFEGLVAWFDSSNTIWVTDGNSLPEFDISRDIRPNVNALVHGDTFLCYHNSVNQRWLLVADVNGRLLIYNLDMRQWMPPWTIALEALHSGQTAIGTTTLLGSFNNPPLHVPVYLTPAAFQDAGTASTAADYTGEAYLGLMDITDNPAVTGVLDHIALEFNTIAPLSVSWLTDEDPDSASWDTATGIDPPNRTNGTNLVEKWYPVLSDPNNKAARRASILIQTTRTGAVQGKIYTIALAYKEIL